MEQMADTSCMATLMIIFLVAVGPLALLFGVDSTLEDTRDKRRWL
jgi:hypothetical protein